MAERAWIGSGLTANGKCRLRGIVVVQLRKLILKPTVFCFHNCGYCRLRQDFYGNMVDTAALPSGRGRAGEILCDDLLDHVRDACRLGMRECQISGGDPLLYQDLARLIRGIKEFDGSVFVFMNSVGAGVSYDRALEILDAGLGAWNLSVDTLDPDDYDGIRGVNGGLVRVLEAFNVLRKIREVEPRHRRLWINFMTVLTRRNYRRLPDLFRFSVEHGVSSIYLMQVYGDDENRSFLLSVNQIDEFRRSIVPEILRVLQTADVAPIVRENARAVLSEYFGPGNTDDNYAAGLWWNTPDPTRIVCRVPEYSAQVEPDGKVLPCCMAEIAHDGVVGDIFRNSLTDIWNGSAFESFRRHRMPFCRKCSAPLHRTIGLVPEMCRQFDG